MEIKEIEFHIKALNYAQDRQVKIPQQLAAVQARIERIEAELQPLHDRLQIIDPALVNKPRYQETCFRITQLVYNIFYFVKTLFYHNEISHLQNNIRLAELQFPLPLGQRACLTGERKTTADDVRKIPPILLQELEMQRALVARLNQQMANQRELLAQQRAQLKAHEDNQPIPESAPPPSKLQKARSYLSSYIWTPTPSPPKTTSRTPSSEEVALREKFAQDRDVFSRFFHEEVRPQQLKLQEMEKLLAFLYEQAPEDLDTDPRESDDDEFAVIDAPPPPVIPSVPSALSPAEQTIFIAMMFMNQYVTDKEGRDLTLGKYLFETFFTIHSAARSTFAMTEDDEAFDFTIEYEAPRSISIGKIPISIPGISVFNPTIEIDRTIQGRVSADGTMNVSGMNFQVGSRWLGYYKIPITKMSRIPSYLEIEVDLSQLSDRVVSAIGAVYKQVTKREMPKERLCLYCDPQIFVSTLELNLPK